MNKKSLLKLLVPITLIIVMVGALPLFTGCMPGQQEIAPPPEELIPPIPEQPSEGVASISVDKKVGPPWQEEIEQCVCQNVEFQIIVSNDGDVPLTHIEVSDLIPAGLDYNSGSAVPSPTPDPPSPLNNPIWIFAGPLAPNSSIQITFSAHVASEGEHENWVKVQARTDDGVIVNDEDWAVVEGTICEPEPPIHKMHYPQYPDVDGWDVYSCKSVSLDEMIQVADDWECTESGLVENIRFWGSWKDGVEGQITGFHIEIYNNNPGGDYSYPDDLLWDAFITDYSSEAFELAAFEGWYNPWTGFHEDFDHNTYYQYDITDIQDAFWQEEGNIYWLSIWPVIDGYAVWGWKSSQDHWMDDACWSVHLPQTPAVDWQDLYEPTPVVQSLDLAFVIYGGEVPRQCEDWDDVEVSWTDESGTSQSWTGSCGDTVEPIFNPSGPITVNSSIGCIPDDYSPDYTWEVTTYSGMSLPSPSSGSGLPAEFTPQGSGWNSYVVTLNASCDDVECPPCIIYMRVETEEEVTPSISVDKMVSVDGGETWVDEVEQNVCQNVQFQITVTNDGDVPLSNIVISDYLPDCLEYVNGPAVEVCKTIASIPSYYNLPGTDTPTWKCTSGLLPGNSVQVIYTAHVVEGGGCKNQVSVEGEYNGQIVTDEDGAAVTGSTCAEESVTFTVGECDEFNLPTEATSPSQTLLDWISAHYAYGDTRDCDEDVVDRYWAHTFTRLEPPDGCHIVSATLEITVRNNHYNDSLLIGFIDSDTDTWDYSRSLDLLGVPVGVTSTIILDLSSLPTSSGSPVNLLSSIGYSLDVAVQDDSMVDCAKLLIVYGP